MFLGRLAGLTEDATVPVDDAEKVCRVSGSSMLWGRAPGRRVVLFGEARVPGAVGDPDRVDVARPMSDSSPLGGAVTTSDQALPTFADL